MLFIAIIILNIIIGTAQELKAKKLVDELSILNRPVVRLIMEGRERQAAQEEVVKGDLVVLESGSQICNDAVVVNGTIEVNESLLTGESDPVPKGEGGELYSGSFVMAGKAYARVTHVGEENYAAKLVSEVRKEKRVESELLGSMRRVTNFTSVCIIPLGVFLFLEAMLWRHTPVAVSYTHLDVYKRQQQRHKPDFYSAAGSASGHGMDQFPESGAGQLYGRSAAAGSGGGACDRRGDRTECGDADRFSDGISFRRPEQDGIRDQRGGRDRSA